MNFFFILMLVVLAPLWIVASLPTLIVMALVYIFKRFDRKPLWQGGYKTKP